MKGFDLARMTWRLTECEAVDQATFRQACIDLVTMAQAESRRNYRPFIDVISGYHFPLSSFNVVAHNSDSYKRFIFSSIRLSALLNVLQRNCPLFDDVDLSEPLEIRHLALFDAAAISPVEDGAFLLEELQREYCRIMQMLVSNADESVDPGKC